MSLNHKMAEAHEADLAGWFGGRRSPGSGNQWHRPMDGRQDRYADEIAFAWDGKATRGESISVTRKMLRKAVEQAGGERPMLALRFYDDDRLRGREFDLVAVAVQDFLEVIELARAALRLRRILDDEGALDLDKRVAAALRYTLDGDG